MNIIFFVNLKLFNKLKTIRLNNTSPIILWIYFYIYGLITLGNKYYTVHTRISFSVSIN